MKFSPAALLATAQKRDSADTTAPAPAPKRARVDAAAPPAPRIPASEKGKAVMGQPAAPSPPQASEPEIFCVESGATVRREQLSSAVPSPARVATPIPAPAPPPPAPTPSSQAGGSRPAPPVVAPTAEGGSALRELGLARQLIEKIVLPRDRQQRKGRSRTATLLGILPQLIAISIDVLLSLEYKQAAEARDLDKDKKLHGLEEDIRGLKARERDAQARLQQLEEELRRSQAKISELERARSEERALAERRRGEDAASLSRLNEEIRRLENDLIRSKENAEKLVKSNLFQAEQLEKARVGAREAVSKYKASAEFEAESMESAADSYIKGASRCWMAAKKLLVEAELEKLTTAIGLSAKMLLEAAEPEDDTEAAEPEAAPENAARTAAPEPSAVPEVAAAGGEVGGKSAPVEKPSAQPGPPAPPKQS